MTPVTRRQTLRWLAATTALAGCVPAAVPPTPVPQVAPPEPAASATDPVLAVTALGQRWTVPDPFLFCVHHDDSYPQGNAQFGPDASLEGRDIGQDFAGKDGWRMYHGDVVPGFPRHPHRGFETVTVVRRGLLDHSDSMGAAARYGGGDVQWLTAGGGIQHAEMFPLLESASPNPVELFQIWLNLPAADKHAPPHFSMLWRDTIPRHAFDGVEVVTVAGTLGGVRPPSPPPKSYGSRPEADVAIWTIKLAGGAKWTIPATVAGVNRALYVFRGQGVTIAGTPVASGHRVDVASHVDVALEAQGGEVELLMLQGRPIGEPVVKHGPFVMTSREEIEQAYADYHQTQFGGWPWDRRDPVHARDGRFAKFLDGHVERPA